MVMETLKASFMVTETKPYGDSTTTVKLECEGRMCTRKVHKTPARLSVVSFGTA
jgi:hypothetical protein